MPDSIQPTNPDTAVPENASDLEAKVAARAAAIEAKVADKIPAPPKETKLPKDFVLDCLNRNKVGDAALFCALFRGKYVFVQEWEKFLYWSGHFWQVDMRSKRALADSERVCEAYMNAWAECNDEEGSPLHKKILKRLDSRVNVVQANRNNTCFRIAPRPGAESMSRAGSSKNTSRPAWMMTMR